MLGQRQDSPEHHRAMIAAFAEPFARAQAAGAVRADADVTDLSAIVIMLCTVAEASGGRSPHLWRRYLPILLQGMRPGGAPMPVPPLAAGLTLAVGRAVSLSGTPPRRTRRSPRPRRRRAGRPG